MSVIVTNLIANMLVSGDFSSHFSTFAPSALDMEKPVVVLEGAFERESVIEGEERGTVPVTVLVVRELAADAEADAIQYERYLRNCSWEAHSEDGPWRLVGIDTSAPSFRERDSSGRYVWQFEVTVTAMRTV